MQEHLRQYFAAEKKGAFLLILLAVGALGLSAYMWSIRCDYLGAAYPLVIIALLHLVVGITLILRTDGQVATLSRQLEEEPSHYQQEELQRMTAVNRSFKIIKWVEVVLLVIALGIGILLRQNPFWFAVALGLFGQAAISLLFDIVAERRARRYVAQIEAMES